MFKLTCRVAGDNNRLAYEKDFHDVDLLKQHLLDDIRADALDNSADDYVYTIQQWKTIPYRLSIELDL